MADHAVPIPDRYEYACVVSVRVVLCNLKKILIIESMSLLSICLYKHSWSSSHLSKVQSHLYGLVLTFLYPCTILGGMDTNNVQRSCRKIILSLCEGGAGQRGRRGGPVKGEFASPGARKYHEESREEGDFLLLYIFNFKINEE